MILYCFTLTKKKKKKGKPNLTVVVNNVMMNFFHRTDAVANDVQCLSFVALQALILIG